MGDHWILSHRLRACVTVSWIRSAIWSISNCGIARCNGEVPIKVWIRGFSAFFTASQQRSISPILARASPQITEWVLRRAISLTARKSPSDAIGNPASMISTPISSSSSAISSFSSWVIVAPGLCSPSRRVVSKITTRSFGGISVISESLYCLLSSGCDMNCLL